MYICIQRVSPKKTLKCCVLAVSGLEIDIFVKGSVIFQFKQFLMFLSLEICKQLVSEENILMSKIPKKKKIITVNQWCFQSIHSYRVFQRFHLFHSPLKEIVIFRFPRK